MVIQTILPGLNPGRRLVELYVLLLCMIVNRSFTNMTVIIINNVINSSSSSSSSMSIIIIIISSSSSTTTTTTITNIVVEPGGVRCRRPFRFNGRWAATQAQVLSCCLSWRRPGQRGSQIKQTITPAKHPDSNNPGAGP